MTRNGRRQRVRIPILAITTIGLCTLSGNSLSGQLPVGNPLDRSQWRYYSRNMVPRATSLSVVAEGLRMLGDDNRGDASACTEFTFDIEGKTLYTRWQPDGAGGYMGVTPYLTTNFGGQAQINGPAWVLHGNRELTTDHSYNGSLVLRDRDWYYTRVALRDTTLFAVTALGNYDDSGGTPLDSVSRVSPGLASPVRLCFHLNDNYSGAAASLTIGELRIESAEAQFHLRRSHEPKRENRTTHEVFEDFRDGTIPSGWADISTSQQKPRIEYVNGKYALALGASGLNTADEDCGLEIRGLNPGLSQNWVLEFSARDMTGNNHGGWNVGVGEGEYYTPGKHWVEFGINRGSMALGHFGYHFNRIGTGYEPYYTSNQLIDSAPHNFRIESNGSDLEMSIDGQGVGLLQGAAFAGSRVMMGIASPTAEVVVYWVRFRTR